MFVYASSNQEGDIVTCRSQLTGDEEKIIQKQVTQYKS
jgi:hypothetical protein